MEIQLRPRILEDDQFVFDLFYEHKVKELQASQWPKEMRLQFCNMQYLAFEKSVLNQFPNLEDYIISASAKPIGRIVLDKTKLQINMPYLALLSEFQKKSIGQYVLNLIITEAKLNQKNIVLHVTKENAALHLYKKLGFKVTADDGIKYAMVYVPSTES